MATLTSAAACRSALGARGSGSAVIQAVSAPPATAGTLAECREAVRATVAGRPAAPWGAASGRTPRAWAILRSRLRGRAEQSVRRQLHGRHLPDLSERVRWVLRLPVLRRLLTVPGVRRLLSV